MSANGHNLDQFRDAVRGLRAQAQQTRQRRALVLSGAAEWCYQLAREALLAAQLDSDVIWLGNEADLDVDGITIIPTAKARKLLGREYSALVYDLYAGFDPDALGIAAGVVVGGGLLILLVPPLAMWPEFKDSEYARILPAGYGPETIDGRFVRRIVRILREDDAVYLVEQGLPFPSIETKLGHETIYHNQNTLTHDQNLVVTAICTMLQADKPYPLVIIADRGRGKSSALGIAAARLLHDKKIKIAATALRRDATDSVFKHAGDEKDNIEFIPPDELVSGNYALDLLLVDEAAAIPAQMLEKLLMRYPRIVFTSTVHGYEGTGRGFVTRFFSLLDKRFQNWKLQRLTTPIRWAVNDPVEKLIFEMLLLDAEPVDESLITAITVGKITVIPLDREKLTADEARLTELFGLLVAAHYRTRPYDLLNLLDGPNVSGFLAMYDGHAVGAVLLAEEGHIDPHLAEQIYLGLRRPRGHLLPQSLAAHGGIPEAASLKYQRVMRIAIHPALQRRGIGHLLIDAAEENSKTHGVDIIGASFGATAQLLNFWLSCGFCVARIGLTREHSSGTHSFMLLKGLTQAGSDMVARLTRKMDAQIPWLLTGPLKDLDKDVLSKITTNSRFLELDDEDKRDLMVFSEGHRGFEVSYVALAKLEYLMKSKTRLSGDDLSFLSEAIHHCGQWGVFAQQKSLSGKAEVIDALRKSVARILKTYNILSI
jgi:tRNA(Met) cytidine acetyltransferase